MSATVEITEEDGEYTAVDLETGTTGVGKTRALALATLAVRLGTDDELAETDLKAELQELADRTRQRFEDAEVAEDDVADAISWARSE